MRRTTRELRDDETVRGKDGLAEGELTQRILGGFYRVHTSMGHGFVEPVYQRALAVELIGLGLQCEREVMFPVFYKGVRVGDYRADLVVEGRVLLELKCADQIAKSHIIQLLNYLKASAIPIGLLLNFGPEATFRRVIL